MRLRRPGVDEGGLAPDGDERADPGDEAKPRLALARTQQLPYVDFLELLLADEVCRRDTNSAMLRARSAGLDPGMRLDTWDPSAAIRFDQQLWNELCSLRFVEAAQGALLLGPVGVGRRTWPRRWATPRCRSARVTPSSASIAWARAMRSGSVDIVTTFRLSDVEVVEHPRHHCGWMHEQPAPVRVGGQQHRLVAVETGQGPSRCRQARLAPRGEPVPALRRRG